MPDVVAEPQLPDPPTPNVMVRVQVDFSRVSESVATSRWRHVSHPVRSWKIEVDCANATSDVFGRFDSSVGGMSALAASDAPLRSPTRGDRG